MNKQNLNQGGKSPPCVKEGGSHRLTGGLFYNDNPSVKTNGFDSSLYTREPPLRRAAQKKKLFENILKEF